MTRVFWIVGVCATLSGAAAWAHEDGHAARIAARAVAAQVDGLALQVTLEVEALEHAATLEGVVAPEMAKIVADANGPLPADKITTQTVALEFAGPVPPLFTLMLVFGDGQLGPVLVIPDFVANERT